jgi:hypothetical protein
MMGYLHFPISRIPIKTDLILPNPVLQHSITPPPLGFHLR